MVGPIPEVIEKAKRIAAQNPEADSKKSGTTKRDPMSKENLDDFLKKSIEWVPKLKQLVIQGNPARAAEMEKLFPANYENIFKEQIAQMRDNIQKVDKQREEDKKKKEAEEAERAARRAEALKKASG